MPLTTAARALFAGVAGLQLLSGLGEAPVSTPGCEAGTCTATRGMMFMQTSRGKLWLHDIGEEPDQEAATTAAPTLDEQERDYISDDDPPAEGEKDSGAEHSGAEGGEAGTEGDADGDNETDTNVPAERAKSNCTTREDARASAFGVTTAAPGTPCVFGVDVRDEGEHCIFDDGEYGSFGWCWTGEDKRSWGSCSENCPLYGPSKVLEGRIDELGRRIEKVTAELKKTTTTTVTTTIITNTTTAAPATPSTTNNATVPTADPNATNTTPGEQAAPAPSPSPTSGPGGKSPAAGGPSGSDASTGGPGESKGSTGGPSAGK
eukprot:CAMPEP_0197914370 /NCGR_PEP_ID=MMETSP1439-20131203/78392_1 /TAXON_ID=66791 /ORGANISM="Gonyaulax spinifera, Strain CCMP409" /LENGTH=318 /DNA_ID=CAMNT_0043536279 /DNA_START=62 /DNA_END=1018 /DNA_ORIENTATION=+